MQLNYRGVTYDYHRPMVEREPSGTTSSDKGLEWRFRNLKKMPILQTTLDFKYREVTQRNGSSVAAITDESAKADPSSSFYSDTSTSQAAPVADLARALLIEHHGLIQKRELSMLERVASEVGLEMEAVHN